jgi:hypothetical protein
LSAAATETASAELFSAGSKFTSLVTAVSEAVHSATVLLVLLFVDCV